MLRKSVIYFLCILGCCNSNEDRRYWENIAFKDLNDAQLQAKNERVAKNVIIFVGDGMGPETITAARIYGKTESGFLSFEKFPNVGILKTYSANKLVPDSCSTGTALFSGVKINHATIGVDTSVKKNDCIASLNENSRLENIFTWAQAAGKSTGFVTNTRVTHATPASTYAHSANRKWECEANIPENSRRCKDIARQLIQDLPGKNLNIIMGGGRQCLRSNVTGSELDPISTWACYSKDGRDLIKEWKSDKIKRGLSHAIVENNEQLWRLNTSVDYVLGIFANGNLDFNYKRNKGAEGVPSLSEMTKNAIRVLQNNKNGFLLMVEGGLIDQAHHRGHARIALDEVISFSDAIETVKELFEKDEDTLLLVTSDHAHSMIITGYPNRNQSILDIASPSRMDGINYTSLLYGTGGENNFQFDIINNTIKRRDPSLDDTNDYLYSQQAAVLTEEVYHAGTDVYIYGKGPMAHLIHNTHEQTYVAYLISYASKIGPFKPNSGEKILTNLLLFVVLISSSFLIYN